MTDVNAFFDPFNHVQSSISAESRSKQSFIFQPKTYPANDSRFGFFGFPDGCPLWTTREILLTDRPSQIASLGKPPLRSLGALTGTSWRRGMPGAHHGVDRYSVWERCPEVHSKSITGYILSVQRWLPMPVAERYIEHSVFCLKWIMYELISPFSSYVLSISFAPTCSGFDCCFTAPSTRTWNNKWWTKSWTAVEQMEDFEWKNTANCGTETYHLFFRTLASEVSSSPVR